MAGAIDVPGLGDPNARESNSVAVVNLEDPAAPRLETFIRTGTPFGGPVQGGSSPAGVLAAGNRVFVSNGHNDSVTVIDARTLTVEKEIPIRIPGLEALRGVLPIGLALHQPSGRLLVAEAGINAVGVIDTKTLSVLGHLPAAWFPTRVAADDAAVVRDQCAWPGNRDPTASAAPPGTRLSAAPYGGAPSPCSRCRARLRWSATPRR